MLSKLIYYFNHPFTAILLVVWGAINIVTAPILIAAIIPAIITTLIGITLYYDLYYKHS